VFAVIGTVPEEDFPLLYGEVRLEEGTLRLKDHTVAVQRGTPALIAAAVKVAETLGVTGPLVFLVGDIGRGEGSRRLYAFLSENLKTFSFDLLTFHYLMPDVDWHNRVLFAVEEMHPRPLLVADAGFMYAAKMSGQAAAYDLFTPDLGELAFLADEEAPHPFYTRGFILHEENRIPDLVARAYAHRNAAPNLLVKGVKDHIVIGGEIRTVIDRPLEEAMEAIGGTGDTLTGIVSALLATGLDMEKAAVWAARINRLAGQYARPNPATPILEIIQHLPRAVKAVVQEEKG
jgi:hypothetical protein